MNERHISRERTISKWRNTALVIGAVALTACTGIFSPNIPNTNTQVVELLNGQHWQIAGAKIVTNSATDSDLHISPTNLAIVKQDGSSGQENQPVNLYGTRLSHKGDFSITYTITERTGEAEVSFYGEPPIILDEARAEVATIHTKLSDGKFIVNISDQKDGLNNDSATYDISPINGETAVTMSDTEGKLSFTTNGKQLGEPISDHGLFDSGNVWFGMNTRGGDSFRISSLTAKGEQGGTVRAVDTRKAKAISLATDGLASLATKKRSDFVLGTAVATGPMIADAKYREILFKNFNGYSTENAGKWQTIHPAPGIFNFTETDAIIDMAQKTGARVHGHTLIFGEANPAWVQDLAGNPEALKKAAIEHITTIMKRYKGRVKSWDVINEPLAHYDTGPGERGLRKNIWYDALGPDYLEFFMRAAQAADPDADLVVNDFGMESDEDRFNQMLTLVSNLKNKGINNLVIGFQAHIDENDTMEGDKQINTKMLRDRFNELKKNKLHGRFSEVDINNGSEHAIPAQIIKFCIGETACNGVTTWGPVDRYGNGSEVDSAGILYPSSGRLWDEDYNSTKGVDDIKNTLR